MQLHRQEGIIVFCVNGHAGLGRKQQRSFTNYTVSRKGRYMIFLSIAAVL